MAWGWKGLWVGCVDYLCEWGVQVKVEFEDGGRDRVGGWNWCGMEVERMGVRRILQAFIHTFN